MLVPRDDANMCVGRRLCRAGAVEVGEYLADLQDRCWRHTNAAGRSVNIAFARVPFELRFADRRPQVASASHVVFANTEQPFDKTPLDERGEWTDWIAFDPAVAADVMRPALPWAAERPTAPFDFSFGPCPSRLYLRQRRLHEYARCARDPDPLCVEETAIRILEAAIEHALLGQGTPRRRQAPRRVSTARAHRDACHAGAAYLAQNSDQRLTLADVGTHVGIAPAHFSRMFRRELGLSVHEYLTRLRLADALDRIDDFAGSTVDLAVRVGFAGRTHLADALRAGFGAAPTHLREQLRLARIGQLRTIPDA